MSPSPKITPFLWFDGNAEEAMNHHVSIFRHSKILGVTRKGGEVFTATFQLEGQKFMALNGGPVGEAGRRRPEGPLRVAQGQVWAVVANHPIGSG